MAEDYLNRIQKFCPMLLEEIPEEAWNPKQKLQALKKEEKNLMKRIKKPSYLILLDETGKEIYHSATEVNRPTYRTRVDIASFPKGKYKIVIYTNDGRYVRNFQK